MDNNIPSFKGEDATALLREVVDEMHEGFQVIDREWRYVYVNGTVARHGKKTKEELIGKTMTECYPGIEKTEMFALCKKAMDENQSSKMFNEFVYPDGSHGWFELVIHPAKNGILILSLDVTSRKHIEDELKEKIREVQVLLGSTTDREIRIVELRQEIEILKLIANKEESAAE